MNIHAFIEAIEENNLEKINKILSRPDINFNETDDEGCSFLWHAVNSRKLNIIKQLLDKQEIDINQANHDGESPLWIAIFDNNPDIVKLLINQKKINLNQQNNEGYSPLLTAIERQYSTTMKALLSKKNIELNLLNNNGQSALDYALLLVQKEETRPWGFEVIQELLNTQNINLDSLHKGKNKETLLSFSAYNKKWNIIHALLTRNIVDLGFSINGNSLHSIIKKHGDFNVINLLLNERKNPSQEKFNLLASDSPSLLTTNIIDNPHSDLSFEQIKSFLYEAFCTNNENSINCLKKQISSKEFNLCKTAYLYKNYISLIPKMIISGIESKETSIPESNEETNNFISITNFSGYQEGTYIGNPIEFTYKNEKFPIGYDLIFPTKQKIEHVIIEVYGGSTRNDLKKYLTEPPISRELLYNNPKKNCAVINLFLPDYLQDKPQQEMDAELENCIQQGIHSFYTTIKNNPESIYPVLSKSNFKSSKYFLFGQSFGGCMVIHHAQSPLFANTFNGYIAHAPGAAESKDMPIIGGQRKVSHPNLSPLNQVEKLNTPLLILHNKDDNNVTIEATLKLFRAYLEKNKAHLVSLRFFEKGSPAYHTADLVYKGHFIPPDRIFYWDSVFNFMEHGQSKIPELHQRFFLLHDRYAKQFFRDIEYAERFLALAHQKIHDNKTHASLFVKKVDEDEKKHDHAMAWDTLWSKEYRPLLIALKEIDIMKNNPDYLKTKIKYLMDNGLITDDAIKLAIKNHAKLIKELIKEMHHINISEKDIVDNPDIIAYYRRVLTSNLEYYDENFRSFILENFYFSNPPLLGELKNSKEFDNIEEACRADFELKLMKIRQTTKQVWTTASNLAVDYECKLLTELREKIVEAFALQSKKPGTRETIIYPSYSEDPFLKTVNKAKSLRELLTLLEAKPNLKIDEASLQKYKNWCTVPIEKKASGPSLG